MNAYALSKKKPDSASEFNKSRYDKLKSNYTNVYKKIEVYESAERNLPTDPIDRDTRITEYKTELVNSYNDFFSYISEHLPNLKADTQSQILNTVELFKNHFERCLKVLSLVTAIPDNLDGIKLNRVIPSAESTRLLFQKSGRTLRGSIDENQAQQPQISVAHSPATEQTDANDIQKQSSAQFVNSPEKSLIDIVDESNISNQTTSSGDPLESIKQPTAYTGAVRKSNSFLNPSNSSSFLDDWLGDKSIQFDKSTVSGTDDQFQYKGIAASESNSNSRAFSDSENLIGFGTDHPKGILDPIHGAETTFSLLSDQTIESPPLDEQTEKNEISEKLTLGAEGSIETTATVSETSNHIPTPPPLPSAPLVRSETSQANSLHDILSNLRIDNPLSNNSGGSDPNGNSNLPNISGESSSTEMALSLSDIMKGIPSFSSKTQEEINSFIANVDMIVSLAADNQMNSILTIVRTRLVNAHKLGNISTSTWAQIKLLIEQKYKTSMTFESAQERLMAIKQYPKESLDDYSNRVRKLLDSMNLATNNENETTQAACRTMNENLATRKFKQNIADEKIRLMAMSTKHSSLNEAIAHASEKSDELKTSNFQSDQGTSSNNATKNDSTSPQNNGQKSNSNGNANGNKANYSNKGKNNGGGNFKKPFNKFPPCAHCGKQSHPSEKCYSLQKDSNIKSVNSTSASADAGESSKVDQNNSNSSANISSNGFQFQPFHLNC